MKMLRFILNILHVVKECFFIREKLLVYKRGHSSSIMTQTKQGTIKAIDHLYIAKDIYDFWLKNKFITSKQTIMTQLFIDFFNFSLGFVPKDDRAKVLTVANNLLLGMSEIIIPLSQKLFAERFNDLITRLKLDFIETTKLVNVIKITNSYDYKFFNQSTLWIK